MFTRIQIAEFITVFDNEVKVLDELLETPEVLKDRFNAAKEYRDTIQKIADLLESVHNPPFRDGDGLLLLTEQMRRTKAYK